MGFLFNTQTMKDDKIEDMSKEERLQLEEQAIEALLSYGVKFSVPLKIEVKEPPRWIRSLGRVLPKIRDSWRNKNIPKNWNVDVAEVADLNETETKRIYKRYFHIKPLYLGTMDIIRKLTIEIDFDEVKLQENSIPEGERLMKYISLMAKIVAVATINCSEVANVDSKEVADLQQFYLSHLTASRLQKLCSIISKMSDTAGFTNSIRLIRVVETPQPKADRVE